VIDKDKILGAAQKYILKGQSKKAIKEYQKLIDANPEDKRLHLKVGDLYLKNGENDLAIREFLQVAELYAEEELNFRAISIYKKVLSIDQKSVEAFHKIAKLYAKEGLTGSAKNYYQDILKIDPKNQEAVHAIQALDEHQVLGGAQPESVLEETPLPDSPPGLQGESVDGGSHESLLPANPPGSAHLSESTLQDKDSQMHYHLGIAYKEMELFDYAITEFELARSDSVIRFDCYIMLGNCYVNKGDYDKSIEAYRTAMEIEGLPSEKLARLQYNLGLAYEAKGMIEEAMNTYNLALKSDHSFLEAQERLRILRQK
jgi:tetratricopeptide (TPR) repeat protein